MILWTLTSGAQLGRGGGWGEGIGEAYPALFKNKKKALILERKTLIMSILMLSLLFKM